MKNKFVKGNKLKRLKGALRSGHPAVRLAITIKVLQTFTFIIDAGLKIFLPRTKFSDRKDYPKVLMIVGSPRCGATMIYQILTRLFPCVYLTNLHALFPNFASYYYLKKQRFGKNLQQLKNYYGYTAFMNDVYEGNEFIDPIFEKNNKESIRKRFISFIKKMRANNHYPLIFKNTRNYCNISKLYSAFPEILFLRIKRNIAQIIQSELRAYRELGYFHPVPEILYDKNISDPLEFAVYQIIEIEKSIDQQSKEINSANWIECWYEDFCDNPEKIINHIAKKLCVKPDFKEYKDLISNLKLSSRKKVTEDEARRISELLKKLAYE